MCRYLSQPHHDRGAPAEQATQRREREREKEREQGARMGRRRRNAAVVSTEGRKEGGGDNGGRDGKVVAEALSNNIRRGYYRCRRNKSRSLRLPKALASPGWSRAPS